MVVNIRMDDADSGLMVREGPGLQSLGRPIPANATGVGITGACNTTPLRLGARCNARAGA